MRKALSVRLPGPHKSGRRAVTGAGKGLGGCRVSPVPGDSGGNTRTAPGPQRGTGPAQQPQRARSWFPSECPDERWALPLPEAPSGGPSSPPRLRPADGGTGERGFSCWASGVYSEAAETCPRGEDPWVAVGQAGRLWKLPEAVAGVPVWVWLGVDTRVHGRQRTCRFLLPFSPRDIGVRCPSFRAPSRTAVGSRRRVSC